MNCELPDVQTGFRKGRGTRGQIGNICWIIKKAREFQKNIYLCFIDYAKAFTVWIPQTVENSERDVNTRPPDLPLEKPSCRSGSNIRTEHGTTDWFQRGKGVCHGCILSPCYLTYRQTSLWEMLDWMKHKLESRLPGKISVTSDLQMTPHLRQKVKKN